MVVFIESFLVLGEGGPVFSGWGRTGVLGTVYPEVEWWRSLPHELGRGSVGSVDGGSP